MHLEISAERAARLRVWILIPCRTLNSLAPHHVTLLGTLRAHGIWYTLRTLPGDSLVTRARNNLADVFYRESTDDDTDFALWLDDDIVFSPESVLQLLALDLDFVAAPYTRKGLHMDRMHAAATLNWKPSDLESVAGTPNVNYLINSLRLDEPTPVLEAGSGFWLTKRRVYRLMVESLPAIRYRRSVDETAHYGSDHAHDFFRVGVWPETSEYLSEDWWFCREWRKLGGVVYCAFWIKTQHIGPHLYQMNMDAITGLLNSTGGYIHGDTWPNTHTNKNKETPSDAPTPVRQGTSSDGINGDGGANGATRDGDREWRDRLDGIIRRLSVPASRPPDEAAGPRDPGPLGG